MPGHRTRRAFSQRRAVYMMRDRGFIQTKVQGPKNAYGTKAAGATWRDGQPMPMTYVIGGEQEAGATIQQVATTDAEVHLPLDAQLTSVDRIVVTHRNGERLLVPIMCEAVGDPKRELVMVIIKVKTVIEHT